jgi:hypothetical protein
MSHIPVFRLRALDRELLEILLEADRRCSTEFALRLDEIRERLAVPLEAVAKSEARIMRRNADVDASGKFVPAENGGGLKFSTSAQQEKLQDELGDLLKSTVELPELGVITKAMLANNGLAVSGSRIANLRPILDTSIPEEPAESSTERTTVILQPPKGAMHA